MMDVCVFVLFINLEEIVYRLEMGNGGALEDSLQFGCPCSWNSLLYHQNLSVIGLATKPRVNAYPHLPNNREHAWPIWYLMRKNRPSLSWWSHWEYLWFKWLKARSKGWLTFTVKLELLSNALQYWSGDRFSDFCLLICLLACFSSGMSQVSLSCEVAAGSWHKCSGSTGQQLSLGDNIWRW